MTTLLNIGAFATATVFATSFAASAALIDFTDDSADLSGVTITSSPEDVNTNEGGPGAVLLSGGATLAGDNDGFGIGDDEITSTGDLVEFVTVDFGRSVRLTGAFFFDLFEAADADDPQEQARITVGAAPGAIDAFLDGTEKFAPGGVGLGELTGLNLVGQVFTFFVGDDNDEVGDADAALAALEFSELAPIPLPASILLLGAAVGGLGAMRRKSRRS